MVGEKFASLTPDQFMAELEKVVAERGLDYTYKSDRHIGGCWYSTEDGEGSCAIGKIIEAVDPDLFQEAATYEEEAGESCGIDALFAELGFRHVEMGFGHVEMDEATLDLAQVAQTLQDRGYRYEAVLELTRRVYDGRLAYREVVHSPTVGLEALLPGVDLRDRASR